jgi:cobalamin biosynthesis protein CbiG
MPARNNPDTAVYALTQTGARLGRRLADALCAQLYTPARFATSVDATPFETLSELVLETFPRYRRHLFIAATGIVARVLAPLLTSKTRDPAVVVMDQQGRFAISFLSGHLGGANAFAQEVAGLVQATPVITTGTDAAGLPAVDELARRAGLRVEHPERIKPVNAALLDGLRPRLFDPENWLGLKGAREDEHFLRVDEEDARGEASAPLVWAGWKVQAPENALILRPPCLCLGLGCRKGAPTESIEHFVREAFAEQGLSLASLWRCGSVEAKRGEPGLLEAAGRLGVELVFFPAQALAAAGAPHFSAKALQAVGTGSVAEASALLLANTKTLLVEKSVRGGVTLAVAKRSPGA